MAHEVPAVFIVKEEQEEAGEDVENGDDTMDQDFSSAGQIVEVSLKQERPVQDEDSATESSDHGQDMDLSDETGTPADERVVNGSHGPFSKVSMKRQLAESSEESEEESGLLDAERLEHTCPVCTKTFFDVEMYKNHMPVHTGEKPHECSFCGKGFPKPHNLRRHLLQVHRNKRFKCTQCARSFCELTFLHQHMALHSGNSPHNCSKCGKAYLRVNALKVHMAVEHSIAMKTYKCSTCKKLFSSLDQLTEHRLVHRRTNQFKCTPCNTRFDSLPQLKEHMALHEKTHKCIKCDKVFPFLSLLNQHLEGHDMHLCFVCGKVFTAAGELKLHQAEHNLSSDVNSVNEAKEYSPPKPTADTAEEHSATWHVPAREVVFVKCEWEGSDGDSDDVEPFMDTSETFSGDPLLNPLDTGTGDECDQTPYKDLGVNSDPHHSSAVKSGSTGVDSKKGGASAPAMDFIHQERKPESLSDHKETLASTEDAPVAERSLDADMSDEDGCIGWDVESEDEDSGGKKSAGEKSKSSQRKCTQLPYKCPTCNKKYSLLKSLREHAVAEHGKALGVHKCSLCSKLFCDFERHQKHVRNHARHSALSQKREQHIGRGEELVSGGARAPCAEIPRCSECGIGFANTTILEAHMSVHTDKKLFECKHCGLGFAQATSREKHLLAFHKEPLRYKCPVCDESLSSAPSLKTHMASHSNVQLQCCPDCDERFPTLESLRAHTAEAHSSSPVEHQCPVCKLTFTNSEHLSSHIKMHDEKKEHKCPECKRVFPHSIALWSHLLAHKNRTVCDACNKSFGTRQGLYFHVRANPTHKTYVPQGLFVCPECDAKFRDPGGLRQHLLEHGSDPREGKLGVPCNADLSSRDDGSQDSKDREQKKGDFVDVEVHEADTKHRLEDNESFQDETIIKGEESNDEDLLGVGEHNADESSNTADDPDESGSSSETYTCHVCDKTFVRYGSYRNHMANHKEKPLPRSKDGHECKVCGRRFQYPAGLKRHMLTHTGEKNYECSECGQRFGRSYHLSEHMLRHANLGLYVCPECGKDWPTADRLKKHMVKHNGERTFKCSICGKGFLTSWDCRRHENGHSKEASECPICSKRVVGITEHLKLHEDARAHICNECGKHFSTLLRLKNHVRFHFAERPHKCGVCGKGYLKGSDCKRHEATHLKVKCHECKVCGERFLQKKQLQNHVQEHHKEESRADC